jgi:hypothetical protein
MGRRPAPEAPAPWAEMLVLVTPPSPCARWRQHIAICGAVKRRKRLRTPRISRATTQTGLSSPQGRRMRPRRVCIVLCGFFVDRACGKQRTREASGACRRGALVDHARTAWPVRNARAQGLKARQVEPQRSGRLADSAGFGRWLLPSRSVGIAGEVSALSAEFRWKGGGLEPSDRDSDNWSLAGVGMRQTLFHLRA